MKFLDHAVKVVQMVVSCNEDSHILCPVLQVAKWLCSIAGRHIAASCIAGSQMVVFLFQITRWLGLL
jgi:hypothetical protein